ncbi:MAG: RnfABCDGE type electron transport complex subunit G, partial [Peptostreptococcaceae bacterium]
MSDKNEKKYSVWQIAMNLTISCFVCGVIIALVYFVTAPISAKNAILIKEQSMKDLVKDAKDFKEIKGKTEWYEAKNNNDTIAYV